MARFKKVPTATKEGKITYGGDILSDIVFLAVSEIPNVELYTVSQYLKSPKNSINVSMEKDGVNVDVTIKTHYQQNVSEVAFKVQEAIRHNVESMTEYHISRVNVSVKDVNFDDDTLLVKKNTENAENTEEKQ